MSDVVRYVIFTGANERAVVAVCRYFQRHGIACSLVARPGPDAMQKTRFARWIEATRSVDHLDVNDILGALSLLKRRYPDQRLVFLPTTESIIRLVLDNRDVFEALGLEVPLVDKKLYETISDKVSFLALMERFWVPLPPQPEQIGPSDLPAVAKPLREKR